MIYLFYMEDTEGNQTIERCRDEVHFMDLLVDIESRAIVVPCDIRWHGDPLTPAMRILAVHSDGHNLAPDARAIVQSCALWLRRN
jgi:hypothetical protein